MLGDEALNNDSGYVRIPKEEYDSLQRDLEAARVEKNRAARELRTVVRRYEVDRLNIETQIKFNTMVTHEKQKHEMYMHLLLESSPAHMFIFDEKLKFLMGTKSITRIIDIEDVSVLQGKDIDSIVKEYSPSVFTNEITSFIKNMLLSSYNGGLADASAINKGTAGIRSRLNGNGSVGYEKKRELSTKDNKKYEISMIPFHHNTGEFAGALVIMHDITEIMASKDTIKTLRKKAAYDGLTHVYNCATFKELAVEVMNAASVEQFNCCLLVIDIDFFKNTNDTYGHACGDLVLQSLAAAIKGITRSNDLLGRLGGDEFGVLVSGVTETAAFQLAEKFRSSVSNLVVNYKGETINTTASIGLSLSRPRQSYEALFEQADAALYQAKNCGRNITVLFSEERAQIIQSVVQAQTT